MKKSIFGYNISLNLRSLLINFFWEQMSTLLCSGKCVIDSFITKKSMLYHKVILNLRPQFINLFIGTTVNSTVLSGKNNIKVFYDVFFQLSYFN